MTQNTESPDTPGRFKTWPPTSTPPPKVLATRVADTMGPSARP
jgi:hypothetical protein